MRLQGKWTPTGTTFAGLSRLALVALAGAVLMSSPLSAEPRQGGTITNALDREPTTFLAHNTTANATQQISPKMFDGLLSFDGGLNPHPQLAESWSVSEDGKSFTFHLRKGVKWHDGEDFTSADVAFTLLRVKEVHPRNRLTMAALREVETPDDHTVIAHFDSAVPYFLHALDAAETPIVPEHIFKDLKPGDPVPTDKLVGTGPFVFGEWATGNYLIVNKNPNYWDAPKPYLDRIVFRFITDGASRAAALETGEVDTGDNIVSPADFTRLGSLPTLEAKAIRLPYQAYHRQTVFNLDNEVIGKKEVRQAIAHAIDIPLLINVAHFGFAGVSPTPISPALATFHDSSIKPHSFDPALAEKMLDEAGYPRGADGIRFKLKGRHNVVADARTAEFVKSALANIGVQFDFVTTDQPTYIKAVYTDRDFDLAFESLTNGYDPVTGVHRIYLSSNFKIGLPFSNGSHYNNPKVDEILNAAALEPNLEKRKALYHEFQKIVDDELPVLNMYAPDNLIVSNKKLKGHISDANGIQNGFQNAYLEE